MSGDTGGNPPFGVVLLAQNLFGCCGGSALYLRFPFSLLPRLFLDSPIPVPASWQTGSPTRQTCDRPRSPFSGYCRAAIGQSFG